MFSTFKSLSMLLLASVTVSQLQFETLRNRLIPSHLISSHMAAVSSCQCHRQCFVQENCLAATYGKHDDINGGDLACYFSKHDVNYTDLIDSTDESPPAWTFFPIKDCADDKLSLGYVWVAGVGCLYFSTVSKVFTDVPALCEAKGGVIASFSSLGRLQDLIQSTNLKSKYNWWVNLTLISGQYKWGDGLPVIHEDVGVFPWFVDNPQPGDLPYVRLSKTNEPTYPYLLRNNNGEQKFAYICSP